MFDVNKLLATTFEDANSTESTPCPEGEYVARIDKIEPRVMNTKNGEKAILTIQWAPSDGDGRIKAATGRDNIMVKQDVWLDLTEEGNLDMGKGMNITLGRLRALFNQNTPGKAWGFNQLIGNVAKVLVTHRTSDEGRVFAEVKSFTSL